MQSLDVTTFRNGGRLYSNYRNLNNHSDSVWVEIAPDKEDEDVFQILRSQRWVLENFGGTIRFTFPTMYRIPCTVIRWAHEWFFYEDSPPKELQVIWDKTASKYLLLAQSTELDKNGQLPILRLFTSEPKVKPIGLYAVCLPPRNENDLYRMDVFVRLGLKTESLSPSLIFS